MHYSIELFFTKPLLKTTFKNLLGSVVKNKKIELQYISKNIFLNVKLEQVDTSNV